MTEAVARANAFKAPAIHRLLWVGALLAAVLIGAAIRHALAVRGGSEIVLQVAPVDPRALLMGHYTHLDYASERAQPLDDLTTESQRSEIAAVLADGKPHRLWLVLAPNAQGYAQPVAVHRVRPQSLAPGQVAMAARARRTDYFLAADGDETPAPPVEGVEFDFGVDRYYADQAEALAVEDAARTQMGPGGEWDPAVQALVSVGRDGVARLKGIVVAGERRELSWF